MHALMQPQIMVPMHGEHRHLRAHANLAKAKGIQSVVAVNGMVINLSGNAPTVEEFV